MAGEPEGLDSFLSEAAPSPQPTQEAARAPAASNEPPGLDDELAPELLQEKYGTPGQQAIAGLEGAAKGIAGPLATGAERLLGVPSEDILGRQEANPVTSYGTEAAGLVGSSLAGVGLGGALAKVGGVGKGIAEAAGLGKIGSSVAQHAIENLAFQTGDEASKLILKDPAQSAESAVSDMGLAAAAGGIFGTISPLWKATMGHKTAGMLGAVARKMGGIESVIPDAVNDTIAKTGMDIAPEIKAGLSGDPRLQQMFKTLEQSDTTGSGREFQKTYNTFRNDAGHAILDALGRTPEDAQALGDLSKAETGKTIGKMLAEEYQAKMTPLADTFENLKNKFKSVELPTELTTGAGEKVPSTIDAAIDKISQAAIDEGWASSPSSDIMREVNRVIKELPLQKNLKNLGDYITQVGSNTNSDPMNGPLRRAGAIMTGILKGAEADVIGAKLGAEEGPAALDAFKAARQGYAAQSALKNDLDAALHVGGSTSGYAKGISEMATKDSETLLRRLADPNDAYLRDFLQKNYPKTAELVKNYHINDLIKTAADKAKPDMTVNSEALLAKLNKMPPELKNFIANPESQSKIGAVQSLIEEFNKLPHNFSNTGRTSDKLLQYVPGSVVAMISAVHGSSPVTAALLGGLTKTIGKDVPDAMRLSMLKFLGSDKEISAGGFKAMAEYINHTLKGETMLSKGTKALFKAGSEVIPESQLPTDKDRKRLEKIVTSMRDNPEKMLDVAGETGHYLPDHATSFSQTTANAIKYLDSQRPNINKQSPLDSQREPNSMEKAQYNRTLDIAQQPLMILKHIAEGKLTPSDVATQRALYPNLYNRTVQKITDQMAQAKAKGAQIPYKTRMGLSMYMGQALDSTMTPGAIQAAQPMTPQSQPQTAMQPASNPKRSVSSLNKMPNMYKTQGQSAEEDRAGRQ